jgi:hypothetical protein
LEHEDRNADVVANERKAALSDLLQKFTLGHYSINSASANYKTAKCMAQKQTGELGMSVMGGMSQVSNLSSEHRFHLSISICLGSRRRRWNSGGSITMPRSPFSRTAPTRIESKTLQDASLFSSDRFLSGKAKLSAS